MLDLLLRRSSRAAAAIGQPDQFTERLVHLLRHHGITTILDVGANEGQFASGVLRAGFGDRVISFEPGSQAHAQLSAVASGHRHWIVHPRVALGSADGDTEIRVFERTDMSSLLAPDETITAAFPRLDGGRAETVPLRRLDGLFDQLVPADEGVLLKIDTQGSELAILDGAKGCVDRIKAIQIEMPITTLYKGQPAFQSVLQHTEALGFLPALTAPGHYSKRLGRQLDVDFVFLRTGTAP